MSRTRLVSALAAGLCILMAVCWFVASTFPLAAAPQVVSDAAGVAVDVGGATLLHRAPVAYPEAARAKGIQGNVVLQVRVDGSGNVTDAQVQTGPEELRRAALESVLQWHFAHEAAGNARQVTIGFKLPESSGPRVPPVHTNVAVAPSPEAKPQPSPTLRNIAIIGLSDDARRELLSKLPVHEGDTITPQQLAATVQAIKQFDEHLGYRMGPPVMGDTTLTITTPPGTGSNPAVSADAVPNRIKIGGNMQSAKLIRQARPIYPPEAKAERIQGVVKLSAVIATDGSVKVLDVLSGHPLLVSAAVDAVKQWVYEPTLLNGAPVEVQTQIDVNFTLSQ